MLEQQPTRLTIDGILQLINKTTFQGQSFVLQTLLHTDNYLGHHYTEMSDGFCQVQCQLENEAKDMVKNGKMKDYDIVRFTTNDCEVFTDSKNPYIVLNKCEILKSQLSKAIGHPMPFKHYKDNGYQNPQASNLIQTGPHIYTIKQVINNTRIKNGHIRATVVKLPSNVNRGFCMFNLRDKEGTEIQAVGFEEAAELFVKELKLDEEYVFSGFVVNRNRKNNEDELKFRKEAQVSRIVKTQKSQTIVKVQKQPQTTQLAFMSQQPSSSNHPQHTPQQHEDPSLVTKQKLVDLIKDSQVHNKLFTIIGKVTYLNPKSTFRKINVQDKNGDVIDLILWEEIKDMVLMEKVYRFTQLRVKLKKDLDTKYVQVHSTKKTIVSAVDQAQWQLMLMKPNNNYKQKGYKGKTYNPKTQEQSYRSQRTKRLPQNSKIISIHQLIQISQQQGGQDNGVTVYPLVECTIKFRTQGLRFRDQSDVLNYFNFFCKPCTKAGTVTLTDNDKISCNRCKRDDVQIKWNLRIRVMDFEKQLPCSIQNEATERFLNMGAMEGYLLFMQSKEEFEKLLHKANFDTRVCKFQIKTLGVNKYFNILEIYGKDTQQLINKHLADMKKRLQNFEKKKVQNKEQEKKEVIFEQKKLEVEVE